MEENKFFNYISAENNAKILSCTSEKENFKCSNILTSIDKVRKYNFHKIKIINIKNIAFMGFYLRLPSRNNHRYFKLKRIPKNKI